MLNFGQIKCEGEYEDGKKTGNWIEYDIHGQKLD